MNKLLVFGLLLLSMSSATAQALSPATPASDRAEYPDIPLSDPAYKDIAILIPDIAQQLAMFTCFYNRPEGQLMTPITNYEFAVILARYLAQRGKTQGKYLGPLVLTTDIRPPLNFQQRHALQRLIQKFQPELIAIGVSIISPAFPDVHKSHWAFSAVEKLRQSGIIVGYPLEP